MLVVTVELWPYGSEEGKEVLAEARIANEGRDSTGHAYQAELREVGDPELGIPARKQSVKISGYDRRQSVWNLLLQVLAKRDGG